MTPAEFCQGMLSLVRQDEPMPNARMRRFLVLLADIVERNPSAEHFESELRAAPPDDADSATVDSWLLRAWEDARAAQRPLDCSP